MNKYRAQKTIVNGITFASRLEARYAQQLLFRQKAGEIVSIEYQVPYVLIPKPNLVRYVADFLVTLKDGSQEVHETKGVWTDAAKIKAKMFRHFYPHLPLVIIDKTMV